MPTMVTVSGAVVQQVVLNMGYVYASVEPLKVNLEPFKYDIGGVRGTYAGVFGQDVTDDDTNYLYLDDDGTFTVNTTGYPTETTYLPLARVVAANGEVVAIHDERVLLASSSSVIGTCRIGFPVDAGVKGGNASVSDNNGVCSLTFSTTGESRNRWNVRPPQNYTSGNLTLRLLCSVAGSPGSNTMRMGLKWSNLVATETLPADYENVIEETKSLGTNDQLFVMDFAIDAEDFDKTADMLAFYLYRNGDHAEDTTSLTLHIHLCELRYTGFKVAGQAGQ